MFLFKTGVFKLFANLCEPDTIITPVHTTSAKFSLFMAAMIITYLQFGQKMCNKYQVDHFFIFPFFKLIPELKICKTGTFSFFCSTVI